MKDSLIKKISTLYFLGYNSDFPGTLASLFGVIGLIIIGNYNLVYYIILFILLILGFAVSGKAEQIFNKKDPKEVVIDEFCGILLSFFLIELSPFHILSGFIFFRAIDIFKPYPIKEIEKLGGSAGIMLDDIVSGIYTNLILKTLEILKI